MIVLDSSAAVEYLARGASHEWIEARLLEAATLHAPHLIDVEVVSGFRRLVSLGRLETARAGAAVADLAALDLHRHRHVPLLDRMWELRHTVRPGDAAFVALTEALGARLVTTDLRLAGTPNLRIEVLTP